MVDYLYIIQFSEWLTLKRLKSIPEILGVRHAVERTLNV